MNKKVITAMMLGALVVSATSLTSCKDYDDDINNLQEQIDKAALKSDVEALKTQLATAQATADAAQKKAEANATDIAAVKDAAKTAGETAAKAVEAAAKAQSSADDAATVAKNAKELADAASKAAAANADAVAAIKKDLADAQAAIAKCATADELNKAITDAKADIEKTYATKADLNAAIAKLQAESATAAALKDAITKLEGEIAAAQPEGYKKLVETVASYKASINELYSALTGVELFATYTGSGLNVSGVSATSLEMLHGIVGEDSKFGDNETYKSSDPIVAFVKGSEIAQNQGVIVKVNPVNVDLTKATVKLINSKGEVLDYVEAGTPEKYDYLITTRGNNVGAGLWKIPFKVKGADEEAFKKATQAEVNGQTKDILYAVAINNTDSAAERYVSSTYDVAPTYKKFAPLATLDYKVNDKDVADIHNRWTGTETKTEDAAKTANINEYTWKDGKPATAAITSGNNTNVENAANDARYDKSPLHVEVNQAFTIKLENTKAKYFYVALDKDRAIESLPSEWNAWSNYSYDGLFKTTAADSTLSLKITSEAANGDIIGFRVFAVNADGTLLDPDGRAFYVQVGEAANTESVTGNDTITSAAASITSASALETAKANFVDMPLTKSFQSSTSNVSGELNLDDATKGNLLGGEKAYYILLKEDEKTPATDWKDAKYVRVGVNNGGNWKDGTQISGTIKAVKGGNPTSAEVTLNTLVVTVKKVLPTKATYQLSFRGVQEDVKGTGKFTLYMLPANGWAATTTSETGSANLDNTFYNLPNNITFTIADAAWKDEKKDAKVAKVVTDKNLVEGVDFIDGGDYHKMVAAVNFGKISTATVDEDGNKVDYKLNIDQNLEVKFACWEMANTYSWGTKKVNNKQVSAKPSIMWNADGNYDNIELSTDVDVKNSYDPNRFSGTLSNLIGTNKYLTIVEGSAHFYYGTQEDPYFEPTIDVKTGKVTINKTQVENAPTKDHEETLSFKVKDCYGHEKTLTLPVTVQRPAKK